MDAGAACFVDSRWVFGLILAGACACAGKAPTPLCDADSTAYARVIAGTDGVCGLDADGSATCWGDAADGAVLDEPFAVLDLEAKLVCGITTAGRNVCWGADVPGVVPPEGAYVAVAVSDEAACWTDSVGLVTCRGDVCAGAPDGCVSSPPDNPLVGVAGGDSSFCGVDATATVGCWGNGPVGVGTLAAAPGGLDECWGNLCVIEASGDVNCTYVLNGSEGGEPTYGNGPVTSGPGPWGALTAGNGFACVLDLQGSLQCSLGMYDAPDQAVSVPEGPFLDIAAGSVSGPGAAMLCASPEAGGVICWTWMDYALGFIGDVCDAPWELMPE